MATYNIVLFHNLNQPIEQKYNENLQIVLKSSFPDLQIDLSNSTDTRLLKYSRKGPRCPCIMIFKDGYKVTTRHGKLDDQVAVEWISGIIGG